MFQPKPEKTAVKLQWRLKNVITRSMTSSRLMKLDSSVKLLVALFARGMITGK